LILFCLRSLFLYLSCHPLDLHSFPTRRSSDLMSKWRLDGVGYTFPAGSVIAGHSFLTLAKSISAVTAARYNGTNGTTLFDEFPRSEEHTSELQSRVDLVCRLLLEKKNKQ